MKSIKYFYADWCRHCKKAKKLMDTLNTEHGIFVEYVNVDVDSIKAHKYSVRSVPTCIVEVDGQEATRWIGNSKSLTEILTLTESL